MFDGELGDTLHPPCWPAIKTGAAYTYDYDRFGNRWHQTGPSTMNLGFDANNRITGSGVTYDAAGNVTNDGQNIYTYDAENRIISESGPNGTGTYVYSAAGLRIRRTTGSGTVDYFYDIAGHAVTEVNSSGAWMRSEVYAGSRHVATYKDGPTGATYFSHTDWLGADASIEEAVIVEMPGGESAEVLPQRHGDTEKSEDVQETARGDDASEKEVER